MRRKGFNNGPDDRLSCLDYSSVHLWSEGQKGEADMVAAQGVVGRPVNMECGPSGQGKNVATGSGNR